MTPAGELAFSRRTTARSAVYSHEQEEVAELSPDEHQAFQQQAAAWHFFQATPPGYKKTVLHWITTAKRSETRVSRLAKLVEACAAGVRLR
ncbi:YdeI/OmpD-associated family protein [Hydrogenophaga crassostreae]|nr:YdeI/OmpD-associated family protein [Hydrogenophaga crassostreae]